ncbi:tyrosine-type recombinase/integrase [Chloroflexota bacterium]
MAAEYLLEALRAKQTEQRLSLRGLASELGVSQPYLSMLFSGKRNVTNDIERKIQQFLQPRPSATLTGILDSFMRSNVHKSPKTIETLQERLAPFLHYLTRDSVNHPLGITREHIDGFLRQIGQGRRGKPLSPASVFGFTKDVRAFVNYIAGNVAPDDWRNPARKLLCKRPQVTIHPLSQGQVDTLLAVTESLDVTAVLKARHKAMIYVLIDGALRISELMNALKQHLGADDILRVFGKGAKEREVALSGRTVAIIQEYLALRDDRSPFLFVSEEGRQLTYEGVKSLFHRWKKAAPGVFQGVRLSAHTLRHTSATMRRIAGMSEGDLQTFLGHSSPVMTRHYSAFALSRSANQAALRTSPVERLSNHRDSHAAVTSR